METEDYIKYAVIILTILTTLSTAWIYLSRNSIERNVAVHTTLTCMTIVLAIEITFHLVNPRPEELTIMGGFLTEFILIGALVLYEWLPTLYRLDEYEGDPKYMRREELLVKSFACLGVVTAGITLLINGVYFISDMQNTADVLNGYGLLFIIPALGVGEAFMLYCGFGGGILACAITCTPIILIVLHYFDLLTALTYILTAVAFFSDAIFGCRHFLKIRYQQENSGEQEMGQV